MTKKHLYCIIKKTMGEETMKLLCKVKNTETDKSIELEKAKFDKCQEEVVKKMKNIDEEMKQWREAKKVKLKLSRKYR